MVPLLLVALLSTGTGATRPPPAATSDSLCIIAHVPEDSLGANVALVRRIFMLRRRFWPDGTPAHPVNLPAASPVRERFSLAVLQASVRDLSSYWDDRYFHGTRPPLSVASERAVLLFVARTKGAVGYVDKLRADSLPEGVGTMFCLPASSGEASGEPPPEVRSP